MNNFCFRQVSNPGKALQTLGSAYLNIMWPNELANGKWLLYPASMKFVGHPEMHCTPKEALNFLNLWSTSPANNSQASGQKVGATTGF